MKKILFFELKFCPYCHRARKFLEELQSEFPEYRKIEIEFIDERQQAKRAKEYNYYLVPSLYIDEIKVFEGVMSRKEQMEEILKQAL